MSLEPEIMAVKPATGAPDTVSVTEPEKVGGGVGDGPGDGTGVGPSGEPPLQPARRSVRSSATRTVTEYNDRAGETEQAVQTKGRTLPPSPLPLLP